MRKIFSLISFLCLGGCVSTPRLDLDGIAVSDVVGRVKCELAHSVPDVSGKYNPGKAFHWLKYWTAKVDLELQTTGTATITPTASTIDPISSGTFTFGFGGNAKTEAYRSDKISFTLSINELMDIKYLGDCNSAHGLGLLGKLGLDEWVGAALQPVADEKLRIGYHPSPSTKAVPIFGPADKVARATEKAGGTYDPVRNEIDRGDGLVENARIEALCAKALLDESTGAPGSRGSIKKYCTTPNACHSSARSLIARIFCRSEAAVKAVGKAEEALETAKVKLWNIKREQASYPLDSDPEIKILNERMKDLGAQIAVQAKAADAAWELLPRDAPLDSITHSVKFTVTVGINASPNWTLVRFRGPSQNSTLLNLQRQRIHELIIVLGSPAEAGGKALSQEQQRQLLNQRLDSRGIILIPPS